jgi:hypothetical protein
LRVATRKLGAIQETRYRSEDQPTNQKEADTSGKRSKPKVSGRRKEMFWSSVLTLTIAGVSQQGHAQAYPPTLKRAGPMIRLRIYNQGISHALLLRSEGEATAILSHAGLEVGWVDCPVNATETAAYPACGKTFRRSDFTIHILTAGAARRVAVQREALGQALEYPSHAMGCSAYVFYRDLRQLARDVDVNESQILGHALAHEIGHLLLGAKSHTPTGIMSAHWRREELFTLARTSLFFTEEESTRMRAEALELNSELQNETPNNSSAKTPEDRNSTETRRRRP